MSNLQAVYWDVDGTLADTELSGHRKAFNLAFNDFGLSWKWDEKTYIKLLQISGGLNRIEYYSRQVNKFLTGKDLKSLHKIKQNYYSMILEKGQIPLRKGVLRLLNELQSNNISQWIVTTSGQSALNSLLRSVIKPNKNFFSGSICYEDVLNHKPDPSAYLLAVKRSGIPIRSSIVIEDSLIGLRSANSANLNCLVTKSPWSKFDPNNYSAATSVVDSLGEPDSPSVFYTSHKSNTSIVDFKYLSSLI